MRIAELPTRSAVAALLALAGAAAPMRALGDSAGPMPIVSVGKHEGGCAIVRVPPPAFNPLGALYIDPAKPGAKEMYATALTAAGTGKRVWIGREHVASPSCYALSDRIVEIEIEK